jgi:hypothetical protein
MGGDRDARDRGWRGGGDTSNIALNSNWSTSSNLLNLFMVVDGTLSVVRQVNQGDEVKDQSTPVFAPAVPLQTGVATVASRPGRPRSTS